jgi:hypothetical protein
MEQVYEEQIVFPLIVKRACVFMYPSKVRFMWHFEHSFSFIVMDLYLAYLVSWTER